MWMCISFISLRQSSAGTRAIPELVFGRHPLRFTATALIPKSASGSRNYHRRRPRPLLATPLLRSAKPPRRRLGRVSNWSRIGLHAAIKTVNEILGERPFVLMRLTVVLSSRAPARCGWPVGFEPSLECKSLGAHRVAQAST